MAILPANVNLSYPKARVTYNKVFQFARTDSSTLKCVLPKDACVVGVDVTQASAAVTGAGAINVGWAGATTALLNAFSLPTTSVGQSGAGAAAGSFVLGQTKLDSDKAVICTYTVGTSTAGGVGFVRIFYMVPGPGENTDD